MITQTFDTWNNAKTLKHLDTISSEVREKRQQGIQHTSSGEHTQNSVPQNKKQLIEIILINFL